MENKLLENQVLNIKKVLETKTENILEELSPLEWTYAVDKQKEFIDAKITVAFGGPNVYINVASATVEGYWGSDEYTIGFNDVNGLYGLFEELYNSQKEE